MLTRRPFPTPSLWPWLALVGAAGAQGVQSLRAAVGPVGSDALTYAFGSGPNFFAAFAIAFIGLGIRFPWSGDDAERGPEAARWFAGSAAVALVGLIVWESLQRGGRLAFDVADIAATVAGVAGAAAVFARRQGTLSEPPSEPSAPATTAHRP